MCVWCFFTTPNYDVGNAECPNKEMKNVGNAETPRWFCCYSYAGMPISEVFEADIGLGGVLSLLWFRRRLPDYATKFIEMILMVRLHMDGCWYLWDSESRQKKL